MHPILGIGIVLAILAGMFGALRLYGMAAKPHPEVLRKAMHIGMGLVTLTFPWLFTATWPVWLLAALAVTALLAVRRVQALRGSVGQVLHGVKRDSTGELCFPIAVAIVFELARGDWVLYVVPILLLTLADALAALIGVRYGQMHYSTVEGKTKSIEGSVAFFVVAFNATLIGILVGSEIGRIESVLIALQIGILIAMVEAVAWKGLDNLLVPVAAFMLLRHGFWDSVPDLAIRLIVLALLVVVIVLWRRRTTLDASGLIAAVLIGFLTWTIGGVLWLVAPLAAFLSYGVLWPQVDSHQPVNHNVQAVLAVCAAAMIVLIFKTRLSGIDFLYLSTVAYGIQLAMIGRAGSVRPEGRHGGWKRIVLVSLIAWLVVFVPYIAMYLGAIAEFKRAVAALPIVMLSAIVFARRYRHIVDDLQRPKRWIMQAAVGVAGTLLAVAPWLLI